MTRKPSSFINDSIVTTNNFLPTMASMSTSVSPSLGMFNESLNNSEPEDVTLADSVTSSSSSFGDNATTLLTTASIPFVVSSDPSYMCEGHWLPVNHMYFQLANVFLFLSYLAPNGIYGILYLRVTLCIGCFFFALWGWVILCAFDTFLWNAVFVVINLVHVLIISYTLRPVRFSAELEQVSVLHFCILC